MVSDRVKTQPKSSNLAVTSVNRFFVFMAVYWYICSDMHFGRIITGGKKIRVPWFIKAEEHFTEDSSIPTAILGKKNAEEIFGKENVFLLDREIKDGVTWIYGKTENRSKYNEELADFINQCFFEKISSIDYHFVNIFTEKYSYFKKLLKYIGNDKPKSVYVTDKHIYVYSGKAVAGLSLSDCRYIGISGKRILSIIKSNPSNSVFEDDSFLSSDEKRFLNGNKIAVPVLHFHHYSVFSR